MSTTDIVPAERAQALVRLGTLEAATPAALISGATAIANQLAQVIRSRELAQKIQGKEYVRVEGWTTLAALLGVIAREDRVEELEDGGYVATVSLVRMSDGAVISTASAECGMDEPKWSKGPRYARRSMAVTRATGKAARLAFSWIMALAGFQPTPAEEMIGVVEEDDDTVPGTVPFGRLRGKPWSELSDRALEWYLTCKHDGAREAATAELERRRAAQGESA